MEAIVTAFVLFIYLILCGISFAGGFYLGKKKRPEPKQNEPTSEEIRQMKRQQKELENFINYRGDRQEDISV